MGKDVIQANYEQLEIVAGRFGSQAEASQQLMAKIRQAMQPLQDGGWQGSGSQSFFSEMDGKLLPAMQRLVATLDQARATTVKVSAVIKAAEEEAARLFQSDGVGTGQPIQTLPTGPDQSDPFHIGLPNPPIIKHDNGFLDQNAPREPTLGDRLNLATWQAKLEVAEAIRPDLVDATAAYRHFLEGNGTDRTFSYERYVENDPSGQATLRNLIIDAQKNAEVISQGRSQFSITSDAYAANGNDARFPYPATENWQKAIGGHNVWTSADVQVTGTAPNRSYSMQLTVNAEDRYNFNPGAADIATGTPDSDNGVFEITGLAHQYMNRGQLTRVVTWNEGDIANTQISDTEPGRNRLPSDNRRVRNRL